MELAVNHTPLSDISGDRLKEMDKIHEMELDEVTICQAAQEREPSEGPERRRTQEWVDGWLCRRLLFLQKAGVGVHAAV